MEEIEGRRMHTRPLIYVWWTIVGVAVFFAAAFAVDGDSVGSFEAARFRTINGWPAFLAYPIWPFMQVGAMGVIPLGAVVAGILRRWRLALGFLMVGGTKLVVAKMIKGEFVRHRPAVLLDDAITHIGSSDVGLGFVSGHATIAVSVAVIVHPYLSKRWMRVALWSVVALVLFGRVYVGAHFPLDVVAGGAVGLAIGSLANLALGVPRDDGTVRVAPDSPSEDQGREPALA